MELDALRCRSCGAPITDRTRCPYCGTLFVGKGQERFTIQYDENDSGGLNEVRVFTYGSMKPLRIPLLRV